MPRATAIAIVTVLAIAIGAVGALSASLGVRPAPHLASGNLPVSPSPSPSSPPGATPSPTPETLPGTAQVVAPTTDVVWVLMNYDTLFVSSDQGFTWDKRSLPAPPGGIRPVISFINDHEGWLLAPGVPATECEEAAADVWHTADGAATWQHLNLTGIDKRQCKGGIWFTDSRHGFVTASDPNHAPTIYRTSDGGSTWSASTLNDPPGFKSSAGGFELSVQWIKSFGTNLYLEAADGQSDPATSHQFIFTSTDGAAWAWKMKVPPGAPVMVTETRLLLLTGPDGPQESTNGGQQWHPYTTDLNLDSPVLGGTQIVFADALVGYETGRGLLQLTDDGGARWVRVQIPGISPAASPSPGGIPRATGVQLSASSTSVVWALVAGQYLFRSTDQGKSWERRNWTLPGSARISFVNATTGWALVSNVATQGIELWRTTDGATTWQIVYAFARPQDAPAGIAYGQSKDAVHLADPLHGYLGASDSTAETIYRTADGGATWTAASLPSPPGFSPGGVGLPISAISAFGNVVLVHAAPFVFRSTDGGVSWTYVITVPFGDFTFVTSTRWLRLTARAETTDGGQSWHVFASDYPRAGGVFPTLIFGDANVGYATLGAGIQRTLDGGAHWEILANS